jgi:hypothetical protein
LVADAEPNPMDTSPSPCTLNVNSSNRICVLGEAMLTIDARTDRGRDRHRCRSMIGVRRSLTTPQSSLKCRSGADCLVYMPNVRGEEKSLHALPRNQLGSLLTKPSFASIVMNESIRICREIDAARRQSVEPPKFVRQLHSRQAADMSRRPLKCHSPQTLSFLQRQFQG